MNYLPPSQRKLRGGNGIAVPQVAPVIVDAAVVKERAAICAGCKNNSNGSCRLFGCCNKSISEKIKWAFSQCPARPPRWLRVKLVKL